ncbi:hypothetical protein CsSME_00019335 [Camellia sinensis var. sinensis]
MSYFQPFQHKSNNHMFNLLFPNSIKNYSILKRNFINLPFLFKLKNSPRIFIMQKITYVPFNNSQYLNMINIFIFLKSSIFSNLTIFKENLNGFQLPTTFSSIPSL